MMEVKWDLEVNDISLFNKLLSLCPEEDKKHIKIIQKYSLFRKIINWFKTGKWIRRKEYSFNAVMETPKNIDGKINIDFQVKDTIEIKEY